MTAVVYAISAARDCHCRERTAAPRRPGRVGPGLAVVPGRGGTGRCVRDPKFQLPALFVLIRLIFTFFRDFSRFWVR